MSTLVEATPEAVDDRPDEFEAAPGCIVRLVKRGAPGDFKPEDGDTVACNYVGKVKGASFEFDRNHGGYPFEFTVGEQSVVPGWEAAIICLYVGDVCTVECAPAMGYGAAGSAPDVPKNATLVFDLELVSMKERIKGSGASDRERLADLRAERETAAAAAAEKKAAIAAKDGAKTALAAKLANKGKKGGGKGGPKKEWKPKEAKEKPAKKGAKGAKKTAPNDPAKPPAPGADA